MAPRSSMTPSRAKRTVNRAASSSTRFIPVLARASARASGVGIRPVPSTNPQQRMSGPIVMSNAPPVSALRFTACLSKRNVAGETRTASRAARAFTWAISLVGRYKLRRASMRSISSKASSPAARSEIGLSPCRAISKRVAIAWRASVRGGGRGKKNGFGWWTSRTLASRFQDRSGKRQRTVGQERHFLAAAIGDLAGLLIEEADDAETIGHFRQRDDGLHLESEVDVAIGRAAVADAVEPVLGVNDLVLRLQALDRDLFDFLGFVAFGAHLHLVAGVSDVHGAVVAENREARHLAADGTGVDREQEAVRALGCDLHVFRHVALVGIGC